MLLLVNALSLGAPIRDWAAFSFEDFVAEHSKVYDDSEAAGRKDVYMQNLAKVLSQNVEYAAGRSTWYATVNAFSDWTADEFASRRLARQPTSGGKPAANVVEQQPRLHNPESMDWRTRGVTTKVKNQGGCGSCWAFASTEVIESHFAIANKATPLTLAPQTFVDCAANPTHCGGTGGCEGSIPELAFNFTRAHGIALEADIPYSGHDASCPTYKPAVTLGGYVKLPANDGDALESAIATVGPVAVNVAAEPWQLYGGGIFSGGCKKSGVIFKKDCDLDHVVAAEGYSTEGEGYWLIRNSWGPGWGEDGYIRLSRKNDNVTFTDTTPADGVACEPFPKKQQVGGESGVLFDMSYPTGVRATD